MSDTLLPTFLTDSRTKVARRCNRIAQKLVAGETTWHTLASELEYQSVLETETPVVLDDHYWVPHEPGEACLVFPIAEAIFWQVGKLNDSPIKRTQAVEIVHQGLDSLWYALAALGAGHLVLPKGRTAEEHEKYVRPYAVAMCHHWDSFLALSGRFYSGSGMHLAWPFWFRGAYFFSPYMSPDELLLLPGRPPEEMKLKLVSVLEKQGIEV
jgi:hypothetical protein